MNTQDINNKRIQLTIKQYQYNAVSTTRLLAEQRTFVQNYKELNNCYPSIKAMLVRKLLAVELVLKSRQVSFIPTLVSDLATTC